MLIPVELLSFAIAGDISFFSQTRSIPISQQVVEVLCCISTCVSLSPSLALNFVKELAFLNLITMSNAVFRWYHSSEIEPCVVLARMLLVSIILIRIVEYLTFMNLVAIEA